MGRYIGELTATWAKDGRCMKLAKDFAYIDSNELPWEVPAGASIDGASIPQVLWPITGSPYVGKYRDASVIHDFYCSVRCRTSKATHQMFYEAMLASGVSAQRAGIMYAAVRYAGPRWSQMDIDNSNLASGGRYGPGGMDPSDFGGSAGISMGDYGGAGGSGPMDGVSLGVGHGDGDGLSGSPSAWTPSNVSAEAFSVIAGQIDETMGPSQIDAAVAQFGASAAIFGADGGISGFDGFGQPERTVTLPSDDDLSDLLKPD